MFREYVQFKGLLPPVDPRRVSEPHIVEGRNFMVGVAGPHSAFAADEVFRRAACLPFLPQVFTTDAATSSWIFLADGVYELNISSGRLLPVFLYGGVDVTYFAPWTHALVGGKHFFANPFVGLIKYDPLDSSWVSLSGGSIPAGIYSITDSGGRLVILSTGIVSWSAIDDGTNLTPSTSTGAGFQSLSVVGSNTFASLLGIQRTAEGFLAFTTNGILRARNTNNLVPYQVTRFSFAQVPLNAWCITLLEDKRILFLASTGLFVTDGNSVTPYNEILGSHLRDNIFPKLCFKGNGYVSLKYLPSTNWVFVLYSSSGSLGAYDSAFVIVVQLGEIGKLSKLVSGIGEFQIAGGTYAGIRAGYIDLKGSIFLFSNSGSNLVSVSADNFDYGYKVFFREVNYGTRYEFGYRRFPVNNWSYTEDPTAFVANNLSTGVYDEWKIQSSWPDSDYNSFPLNVNGELDNPVIEAAQYTFSTIMYSAVIFDVVGIGLVDREQASVDSSITVGLLRLQDEAQLNEMSLVTDVSIGMLDSSSTSDITFIDWMADAGIDHFVDWAAGPNENFSDWGFETSATTDYTATLISSIDGASAIDGMEKVLTLPRQNGKQRIYDAYNTGLYHTVVISAENAGESIALKTLGVEMKQVGVL